MSTMSREEFKKLASVCQQFDPFTHYIDNYRQEIQAEKYNKALNEVFSEIISKYDEALSGGVPWGLTNLGRETEGKLMVWLNANGISVEEEPKPEKRVWTQDEIKTLIQTNDKVLYGALKKLYAQQTADEQRVGETRVHNNVGFNGADSRFLSSTAEFLNRTGFLTDKQKAVVRKKLVKYTKQLTRLANA